VERRSAAPRGRRRRNKGVRSSVAATRAIRPPRSTGTGLPSPRQGAPRSAAARPSSSPPRARRRGPLAEIRSVASTTVESTSRPQLGGVASCLPLTRERSGRWPRAPIRRNPPLADCRADVEGLPTVPLHRQSRPTAGPLMMPPAGDPECPNAWKAEVSYSLPPWRECRRLLLALFAV
jgi:hypothetical protein